MENEANKEKIKFRKQFQRYMQSWQHHKQQKIMRTGGMAKGRLKMELNYIRIDAEIQCEKPMRRISWTDTHTHIVHFCFLFFVFLCSLYVFLLTYFTHLYSLLGHRSIHIIWQPVNTLDFLFFIRLTVLTGSNVVINWQVTHCDEKSGTWLLDECWIPSHISHTYIHAYTQRVWVMWINAYKDTYLMWRHTHTHTLAWHGLQCNSI